LVGLGFGFLALITDSLATHPLRLARWRAQVFFIFQFFIILTDLLKLKIN